MKESMKNISTASYCCKPLNRGQKRYIFPQQRKLMGSSAQNSSGAHWCRSRVRFNEVPEKVPKVPKVPEKVWEAPVQSQVRFNRVRQVRVPQKIFPCKVRFNKFLEKVSEKVWEASVQSRVSFNRICGHLTHGNPAEAFPALGLAARFRKICKNKTLRLLGIPPKLIYWKYS